MESRASNIMPVESERFLHNVTDVSQIATLHTNQIALSRRPAAVKCDEDNQARLQNLLAKAGTKDFPVADDELVCRNNEREREIEIEGERGIEWRVLISETEH